jgi:hypothetical protein
MKALIILENKVSTRKGFRNFKERDWLKNAGLFSKIFEGLA